MQMIDVLKRLAELDSKNPNVVNEMAMPVPQQTMSEKLPDTGFSEPAMPGHDGHLDLENAMIVPDAEEKPASTGPANINISAGSGEEVSNMLATIMQLAGVKQVTDKDMGVEPHGAVLTAEPSMSGTPPMAEPDDEHDGMRDMISAVDKMNKPEDDEEKTKGDEEETDESMNSMRFNNNSGASPTEQNPFDPEKFANHENQPGGGSVTKDHENRPRDRDQPIAAMEEQLMAEYKEFVVENEMAPQAQHVPIGQQMANDGITYSREKEGEIIDLMVQYMKKDGMSPKSIRYYLNYDEDYIPDQLSYLPRETKQDSAAKFESDIDGGMGYYVIDRFSKEPMDGPFNSPEEANKVNHNGGSIGKYPIKDIGTIEDGNPVTQKQGSAATFESKKKVREASGYNPNAIAGKNWGRKTSAENDFRNRERNAGLKPNRAPNNEYGNNINGAARSIYWYNVPKDKEERAQQLAKFGNDQFQQSGGEEGFGFTKAKDGMWMLKIFNDLLAKGVVDSHFGQGQKGDSRGPQQSGNKMMYEGDEDAYDQFVNGNEPNFTGRDEEDFDKAEKTFVNFLKKKGKVVDSINTDGFPVLVAMCQGQFCAWYDLENAHGYLAP